MIQHHLIGKRKGECVSSWTKVVLKEFKKYLTINKLLEGVKVIKCLNRKKRRRRNK